MTFFQTHWVPAFALVASFSMGGMTMPSAHADEWNKRTTLTVNEPIQITDTVLDSGKYVLMLDNSSSNRHVVRIFDENQQHLIGTVMAIPNYRLQPTGNSRFMFWETPPGTAKALRAWFYPGDNFGQEFRYPKHPDVLTAAVTTPPAETLAQAAPSEPPAVTPPPPPPTTAPAQPEVAQNNQPAGQPSNQAPEANTPAPPAPTAQEQPRPRELPQTSSPYTWFGFTGVLLIGVAGLIRLWRFV